LFIDGEWLDSTGPGRTEVISPHTEHRKRHLFHSHVEEVHG
jgi:hypothetical protein